MNRKDVRISVHTIAIILLVLVVCLTVISCDGTAVLQKGEGQQKGGPLLQEGKFKVTYETNPALYPTGGPNEWDGGVIECSDIFYDEGRYYWYYHGEPASLNWVYRIGVATSDSPTGPWERYSGNPVLLETEQESWEDYYVACADVFKEDGVYYMLYNGVTLDEESDVEEAELCRVGIATADNPLGPWTKYAGNPVAYFEPTVNKGGGYYLGGVVKVDGTYYMYMSQYNELAYDYGYMYMATASSIYGPWTMYPSNDNPEPILKPSASWDALGFSEADIFYYNGAFHMFYGGTSDEGDRPESVGYAWSNDGFNWNHFGNEPALPTSGLQNASAFAEVQSRIEYPDIHLYYTLRWKNHDIPGGWPPNANDEHGCPWCEHLGTSRITITK
jgi:predicted GH43/DUF377 family glycosyl hydrolase